MNKKISVIIPAYNKDPVIFKTLSNLITNIKKLTNNFEIIIVNDGSTDNTLFETQRLKFFNGNSKKILIHTYRDNVGKGFALRSGFFNSTGDIIVFFDADLDIDCSLFTKSINLLTKHNIDIVIGSKYHPLSRINYPFIRYVYSWVLRVLNIILFNIGVTDTQVGLKVFQRHVLEAVMPKLVVKKFAFDLELLVVANMFGYKDVIEVPVVINHNSITSSINLKAVKNFIKDTFAIFYRKNILHYYDHSLNHQNQTHQIAFPQQQHI